jgi:hypothetical protein
MWKTYIAPWCSAGAQAWMCGYATYLRGHCEGPEFDEAVGEGRHCRDLGERLSM